jgi:hypothetical protein
MAGPQLLAARASGAIGRELVAVGGVLRSEPLPLGCPAVRLTLERTFCHRLAALFPLAASAGGPTPRSGPPVEGHLLPGTYAPPLLATESELAPWLTREVPVVLVGHYEDQRAPSCEGVRDWCREDFVVELVAWTAGSWLAAPIVRDPALPEPGGPLVLVDRAQANARRATARGEIMLSQAMLRTQLLEVVDPIAAQSTVNLLTPGAWYVRSIAADRPGRRPQVTWAVIDDPSGLVLGYSLIAP